MTKQSKMERDSAGDLISPGFHSGLHGSCVSLRHLFLSSSDTRGRQKQRNSVTLSHFQSAVGHSGQEADEELLRRLPALSNPSWVRHCIYRYFKSSNRKSNDWNNKICLPYTKIWDRLKDILRCMTHFLVRLAVLWDDCSLRAWSILRDFTNESNN